MCLQTSPAAHDNALHSLVLHILLIQNLVELVVKMLQLEKHYLLLYKTPLYLHQLSS